jgi:hypothetical protein
VHRLDGAQLGDRHGEVAEQLEQERLELVVGAIDLVDEQHDGLRGLDRLQQRPAQQEAPREQLAVVDPALGGAQREQLAGIVPVVEGLVDVDALVALQADEPRTRRGRDRLGDFGLPDPGLALEQQRRAELAGQEDGSRQRTVGEIALLGERLADRVGRLEGGVGGQAAAASSSARRVSTRARWRL